MKAQLKRDGNIHEVANVTIHIGETRYRISETNEGELKINKHDFNDSNISVRPCYANEISVK